MAKLQVRFPTCVPGKTSFFFLLHARVPSRPYSPTLRRKAANAQRLVLLFSLATGYTPEWAYKPRAHLRGRRDSRWSTPPKTRAHTPSGTTPPTSSRWNTRAKGVMSATERSRPAVYDETGNLVAGAGMNGWGR